MGLIFNCGEILGDILCHALLVQCALAKLCLG